ncbi:MAG: histidine kinase [Gemmatimonadota bacterium]|nr:GAF domain-containing protein [Gemmatimonadota bacterium]
MNWHVPDGALTELSAALLQLTVTTGLGLLCLGLYVRYRKPWFRWWAVAWGLYALRLVAILSFLLNEHPIWLYWHQVITGWTALTLLWAALQFSRRPEWRASYFLFALFPPLWSYIAIYRLDHFLWAALPAVLFLSIATLWTGAVFFVHSRRVGSQAARWLALAFALWALHHLDYPLLRAQGAWTPWGYYLDIVFELSVGLGILLLVQEDLTRGLETLSALSGDLQGASAGGDVRGVLVERPLTLPAVRGTALLLAEEQTRFHSAAGVCARWTDASGLGAVLAATHRVLEHGAPERLRVGHADSGDEFVSVLPIVAGGRTTGALVIASAARDPFTALDDRFLEALGQQMGAALESAALHRRLRERTAALERLSAGTVRQHEEERKRLSRELHDETAQVFAALSLELGALRERAPADIAEGIGTALGLVGSAITSIRSVAEQLRPALLDDLGLLPALGALMDDFRRRGGLRVTADLPAELPPLKPEAELALFRSLQEALSNVARHTARAEARVVLTRNGRKVILEVADAGGARPEGGPDGPGGAGLAGLSERVGSIGGHLHFSPAAEGSVLRVTLPVETA